VPNRIDDQTKAPLDEMESLPLLESEHARDLGPTVVVAPHPDDESLGCGGLIALLRAAGVPVRIVVMSDGCGSHPNSRAYPPEALRALRESEAVAAVAELGVDDCSISFLRLPDTRVPHRGDPDFQSAVDSFRSLLLREPVPDALLLPWRRDPHADHRATWQIVQAALTDVDITPRVIEYPIWVWDWGKPGDAPQAGEVRGWRLDILPVLPQKLVAISRHRSQTTDLIHDDPDGFRLMPETLAHFHRPWEVFLEPVHG
jgi:LmbE family N-acetylglucosaminyl deacetylase